MREVTLPPFAPAMLNSLRAIGYSFEAALADILDNSVAAGAAEVDIQFRVLPNAYVAIRDDGHGISADRLISAMRHGGVGPEQERDSGDLGRFGLGLKTASLSQCRRLTVITLVDGALTGARWDLDTVEQRRDWILELLASEEVADLPHVCDLVSKGRGTLVLWQDFDRATAGENSPAKALEELMDRGRDHLSLAFHRFLAAEPGERTLSISINNAPVEPLDPFLTAHRSTKRLPVETLQVEGAFITFEPFILPHISRLSADDLRIAGGEEGLRRYQGLYIYRNRRLITSGTWFRILRQEELTKLARVRVDIPNSLDHLWALDVKKSTAYPPAVVRNGLRRVIDRIANTSREVYRFRGRRSRVGDLVPAWERLVVRGGVRYVINRDHPLILQLMNVAGPEVPIERVLRILELSLPTDSLYADMASERAVQPSDDDEATELLLRQLLDDWLAAAGASPAAMHGLLDSLINIEPFSAHPTITRRITNALRNV